MRKSASLMVLLVYTIAAWAQSVPSAQSASARFLIYTSPLQLVAFGEHFYVDIYSGIGVRWRDVTNTHREIRSDPEYTSSYHHPGPWLFKLDDDKVMKQPNFSLGFKLGWRF